MLPKHWDAHGERLHNADFELLLWGYGQLAGAEAALSVLATRATRAAARQAVAKPGFSIDDELPKPSPSHGTGAFPHHTWPELAEYNCFSCHKDLVEPSWRRQRGYPGRIGMATWQTWYFALPLGATAQAVGKIADIDSSINALRSLMETRYDTDPNTVVAAAHEAKNKVSEVLDALALPPVEKAVHHRIVKKMLADQAANDGYVRNWDTAAQVYLSMFALQRNNQTEQMLPGFDEVRRSLAFPHAYDSPKALSGRQSASDRGDERSRQRSIQGALEALLSTLQTQEAGR
jgi:hypothetical protein